MKFFQATAALLTFVAAAFLPRLAERGAAVQMHVDGIGMARLKLLEKK